MLIPLHGFVRGDTLGVLVLVQDTDTIAEVARTLLDAAVVRIAPLRVHSLCFAGDALDPSQTVAAVGLRPLQRVDLVLEGSDELP